MHANLKILFGVIAILALASLGFSASEPASSAEISLEPYQAASLFEETKAACARREVACISERLAEITKRNGPQAALETLEELYTSGLISRTTDEHQLAHEIGRVTSKAFGVRTEAFLLCSTQFNYGCQHGFFEQALGEAATPQEAIAQICGSLETDSSYSPKFKFYCYHGVGHGVLMAAAYDLEAALGICDTLPTDTSSSGCWQGVFMENVNGVMRGEGRSGIFSETDPLAPCSAVAERHRYECYINHAGWLMRYFENDIAQATRACLKAPENYVSPCLQAIGLMVTNPVWQGPLGGEGDNFIEIAWTLCTKFPEGYRHECVSGGVDNLLNFDELDIERARAFCDVAFPYRKMCYERIGASLQHQTAGTSSATAICDTLDTEPASWCRDGTNL